MNPYLPYLYCVPGIISIMSAFPKKRFVRIVFIASAAGIYWLLLLKYVSWAYTHPFNPDDGAAHAFSAVFGGLIGLLLLVLPLHFGTRFVVWSYRRKVNKNV